MRPLRQQLSIVILSLFAASAVLAEDGHTLDWSWKIEPVAGKSDEADLVLSATIKPGWIFYSSDFAAPEFGPRPAKLVLDTNSQAASEGELRAIGSASKSEKGFAGNYTYTYFADRAELRQRIRYSEGAQTVSGTINGQTCYEKSGLCELVREKFTVAVR